LTIHDLFPKEMQSEMAECRHWQSRGDYSNITDSDIYTLSPPLLTDTIEFHDRLPFDARASDPRPRKVLSATSFSLMGR
jgi:hypothetical protein